MCVSATRQIHVNLQRGCRFVYKRNLEQDSTGANGLLLLLIGALRQGVNVLRDVRRVVLGLGRHRV